MVFGNAKCTCRAPLDGKTAIVTGSNTGIGQYTAQDFYRRGARVIMAYRNVEKAEEAAKDIQKACEGFATEILEKENRVDFLINNAGIMFCPEGKTVDGYETQFVLDGPFDLDDLNWEKREYTATQAYYQSKLANILFTKELARKLEATSYCAVDEKGANEMGLYYAECKVKHCSSKSKNMEDADKLWDLTWKIVGLDDTCNPFVTAVTAAV
ncbi:hypothetical protein ILUMI_19615 [Ignelater luminosus]|uniref:Uncharacterized protein n=1 Tax=Ignelater luminosus TaxID=2038154 RepID=A0A8K0G5P6_IGNLU|nr:hypothetical protein ILUMI_19615 [Ignelater luminosus]